MTHYICTILATMSCILGCAAIVGDTDSLEPVTAESFYDSHSAALPSAYTVKLPKRRMIRQIVIHTLDPIRGTDIYVRDGTDRWTLVKEVKMHIQGETAIKLFATGNAVRVVPKTLDFGVIKNLEVFAVPE